VVLAHDLASTVTREVLIRGGEFILPSIISANQDERVFANAHKLDLTRTPNRHIALPSHPRASPMPSSVNV
jgi:cytochrome P450